MSIFGSIMNGIFGRSAAAQTPGAQPIASQSTIEAGSTPPVAAPGSAPATPAAAPAEPVDVVAVLTEMQSKAGQPLNWRQSIVDLMKLLGIDSSLAARKELATELGYTGSTDDSATMNVWLHKQVMTKLAANGGKVPDALKG
ncbi:DUF3597 domain-containing protein [Roseomonas sp. CAU 1739]|uniref:DUF3597 domain-containing protein n=1 Tax=Roseomonas sp. CAU 1739 TaxID=3140364 RepID=UPI00325AD247